MYLSFQFQRNKKEREIYEFEFDFKKSLLLTFQSKKTCHKSISLVSK